MYNKKVSNFYIKDPIIFLRKAIGFLVILTANHKEDCGSQNESIQARPWKQRKLASYLQRMSRPEQQPRGGHFLDFSGTLWLTLIDFHDLFEPAHLLDPYI